MPRNSEMTRQWQVLRDIDAARTGITIGKLAAARGVCQRTIRRDIDALSQAGFPPVRRQGQWHDDVEAAREAVSRA